MFNPADASNRIKEEFIDYITTSFSIADQEYNDLFRKNLNETGVISKGPLVDIKDIFKGGKTLSNLCDNNVLSPLFNDIEKNKPNEKKYKHKFPMNRPLYLHQEKSINVITTQKKNAVVTTGTGSGKTECFLLPVINELLREVEAGTLTPGVRALLIYPMNALANDQMKRLRELLMYYPKITFGVYNGDTERTEEKAIAKYQDLHSLEICEELKQPLENEYISREKMNETPPHILCTNYAMLEHMMLRPENDLIFANSDFKFVVLDEAHIYTGATGMETALLLRRLKARIKTSTKTQFILTSATLGEEGKSDNDIINFAKNLCDEPFDEGSIIYGTREHLSFDVPVKNYPIELYEELAETEENEYSSIFSKYGIHYDDNASAASNIYDICLNSTYYRCIRENVKPPVDINSLVNILNVNINQVISFIHICTLAEKNGKSLIDAKYHFFIRALEGLYTTLYGDKQLFLERKNEAIFDNKKIACFERAVCMNCGELGVVGKIERRERLNKLVLAPQYDEQTRYFHIKTLNEENFEEYDSENNEDVEDEEVNKGKEKNYKEYYLCPVCGAITEKDDGKPRCDCNVEPLIISEYENSNKKCPKCQSGRYRKFYIGSEAATGVLATTLFEELPSKIIKDYNEEGIELEFEGGKQFLAFSDSRSEAAFFASYLDKSYKEFLRRRGVVQVLEELREDLLDEPMPIEDLVEELTKLFAKKQTFKNDLTATLTRRELKKISSKNAWVAVVSELVQARRRTSLMSLGQIKFEYSGNSSRIVTALSKKYNLDENLCKETLDYLALTFAYFGALKLDDEKIDADERKYIFYTDKQKVVTLQKSTAAGTYVMGWKARNREGKVDSFYPNSRVRLVASILNSDEKRANEFLEDYFNQWLIKPENKYHLERGNGNFYYMPVENYQVRVYGDENAHWYKCDKCGKVSVYNINGRCLENCCGGNLREFNPKEMVDKNHFLKLYKKNNLTTLLIKEHTAQLSREEGLKYQTEFEKNHIHALSCSTTFEMGVDVGELETVFLRNVPPTSANYAQRAGRAGRSKNSAAYSLTYAKLSSHDFTYFKEPEKMIVGKINPPVFKTDNRKIVLRHIYAVVLSYFFKLYPDMFNNNKAIRFLEEGGYELLVDLIKNDSPERDSLYELLSRSISNASKYNWEEEFIGVNGILKCVVEEYKENVKELTEIIDEYYKERRADKAQRSERSLVKYKSKELIDFFVRNNILPKYGFPIDTVELDVTTDENQKNELQLSRDLKMAISEYAPGEKVIANNKMYTSRYIKKSFFNNKMDFYTSYVCQCDNCETWNYSNTDPRESDELIKCVACHRPIKKGKWDEAIEPRAGFIAEQEVEEVPMTRPEKIYRSQDSYIGNGKKIDEYYLSIGDREVILKSSENDSIMVTSHSKFYVCKNCGYTYGIHDDIKDESGKKDKDASNAKTRNAPFIKLKSSHKNWRDHICNNKCFYPYVLNHVYKTDVVIIDFQEYNSDKQTMLSVLYALLNAMSVVLGIDRNDIGGSLKATTHNNLGNITSSLVLYDTVAGGAGHVRRLLNSQILSSVFKSAHYAMDNCNCGSSCYNCLRSYSNQRYHEDLNRHLAKDFLEYYKKNEPSELMRKDAIVVKEIKFHTDGSVGDLDDVDEMFAMLSADSIASKQLINKIKEGLIKIPDLCYVTFSIDKQEGYVDYIWKDKKVLLFDIDRKNDYLLAKKSNYHCYILDESFDLDEFCAIIE